MTEVATPRAAAAGLSLSAENLLNIDSAPTTATLDDLVESEVIVGDDSDDEFAFNGEVKDTEEIYVQNGPRGPSLTVGHVTIERSYCTPDDDDVPVKLVDPDRFSDFFLMQEPPTFASPLGELSTRPLQLFSDMRQVASGGVVSYLQVTPAVLSSLQQGRRLESLTEEDENAAQEAPPHPASLRRAVASPPPPACSSAAAAVGRAASAQSGPGVGGDAITAGGSDAVAGDMSVCGESPASVWGAGVGVLSAPREAGASEAEMQSALRPDAETGANVSLVRPTDADADAEMSGPLSLVGIVVPTTGLPDEQISTEAELSESGETEANLPTCVTERQSKAEVFASSTGSAECGLHQSVLSRPDKDVSAADKPLTSPDAAVPDNTATSRTNTATVDSDTVPKSEPSRASFAELTHSDRAAAAVSSSSVVKSGDPGGASWAPRALVDSGGEPPTANTEGNAPVSAAINSVEGTTPVHSEGTVNADGGASTGGAEGGLGVSDSLTTTGSAADILPVLKIDEGADLRSETSETSEPSVSSRSSGVRADGKTATPRSRGTKAATLTSRVKEDLSKKSAPATREEKRTLSNYATLPRNKAKKTSPKTDKELPAVSEIAKKTSGKPAVKTPGSVKQSSLEKNSLDWRRSASCDEEDRPSTGTLGRRKKTSAAVDAAELKRSADKYGTIGRKKKTRSEPQTADGPSSLTSEVFTAEDMKKSADTFATLGRRKKIATKSDTVPKAATGAVKPTVSQTKPSSAPTKAPSATAKQSTGAKPTMASRSTVPASKPAASKPAASTTRAATTAAKSTVSKPSSSSSSTTSVGAKRPTAPARVPARTARPVPNGSSSKPRERTLICMETSCQTVLTSADLAGVGLRQRPDVSAEEAACQAELPSVKELELVLELQKLQREMEEAHAARDQLQQLQCELEAARRQLTEESADKQEVQEQLSLTSDSVRQLMGRMEGVEAELLQHQQGLQVAEQRAATAEAAAEQLQSQLDQAQLSVHKLTQDLEKSVAAQKTLLQQVQETEAESRELHEFMQLEKNALVDALREAESEVAVARRSAADSQQSAEAQETRCRELTKLAELRADEMATLKDDLQHLQSRTRDLLLCQGAGVSGASVALSQLAARLEMALASLLPPALPHAASVPARLAAGAGGSSARQRRSTSLVSPGALSQTVRALDLPSGESLADERLPLAGADSLQELAVRQLLEGRDSPEGEECCQRGERADGAPPAGLEEQVQTVDALVERLIQAATVATPGPGQTAAATPACHTTANDSSNTSDVHARVARLEAENAELRRRVAADGRPGAPSAAGTAASPLDNETASLHAELQRRDRQLEELKQKYIKHKQILTENVQKAESEIQTLDEIIDYVISSLGAVPDVVQRESTLLRLWLDLDGPNKLQAKNKLNGAATHISDLNANATAAADIVKV